MNHRQDNWDILLPLCEFAINNSHHSSISKTHFHSNYGFNPQLPPDLISASRGGSIDWLQQQHDALKIARDCMIAAQARQALYADRGRTPSELNTGDPVLVHRDFLITAEPRQQPSRKLQPKWFGPFTIVERIAANANRLDLPGSFRCHPVFNVTALKPYKENVIPGRRQPAPPSFSDLDDNTRFIVEAVLAHRRLRSQIQYLVYWKGYPLDKATWEPRDHLLDESGKPIVQLAGYVRQHPH